MNICKNVGKHARQYQHFVCLFTCRDVKGSAAYQAFYCSQRLSEAYCKKKKKQLWCNPLIFWILSRFWLQKPASFNLNFICHQPQLKNTGQGQKGFIKGVLCVCVCGFTDFFQVDPAEHIHSHAYLTPQAVCTRKKMGHWKHARRENSVSYLCSGLNVSKEKWQ